MKKKVIALLLMCLMVFSCVGCGKSYQEVTESPSDTFAKGYFTVIKEWGGGAGDYRIVYANDTKVMYFTYNIGYHGGITPLYNADGTLQIYEEAVETTKGAELVWLEKK